MMDAASAATLLYSSNGYAAGRDQQLAGLSALGSPKNMNAAQADKAAQDFEAMFLAQMLEQMFGDSLGAQAFGDEETSEIYKGLMVEQYGKVVTQSGGIGIADYVKRELLKLQEK
jgi:Rod binding domain-containing protein